MIRLDLYAISGDDQEWAAGLEFKKETELTYEHFLQQATMLVGSTARTLLKAGVLKSDQVKAFTPEGCEDITLLEDIN